MAERIVAYMCLFGEWQEVPWDETCDRTTVRIVFG